MSFFCKLVDRSAKTKKKLFTDPLKGRWQVKLLEKYSFGFMSNTSSMQIFVLWNLLQSYFLIQFNKLQ